MPSRTTGKRKCKETLTQVRERLTREQNDRTNKRIRELLDREEVSSDSDSEEEQDNRDNQSIDSLALLRRDLYLGLLSLLLLVILASYWTRCTCLRI